MRRYGWPIAIIVPTAAIVGVVMVTGAPQGPAPSPPTGVPRVVVALGDSTMSGEAAGDYDSGTDGDRGNWCHRSRNASIHHTDLPGVAETINLACSGANTEQVRLGETTQYGETSQARRLGALARQKRVVAVVVAVGANDDPKFARVLDGCVQAWVDRGKRGCAQDEGADWRGKVDAMTPKVRAALADIRSAMRDAGYQNSDYELVMQSYAAPISPDVRADLRNLNGCPFRTEDLNWVRDTAVPQITDGVRRAAREADVRYLDLSRAGQGHEACSHEDAADEWFSRLSVRWADLQDNDRASHALQESFHPNAAGHAAFGRCLGEFLATTDRAAACLPSGEGELHAATSIGP